MGLHLVWMHAVDTQSTALDRTLHISEVIACSLLWHMFTGLAPILDIDLLLQSLLLQLAKKQITVFGNNTAILGTCKCLSL